MKLNTEQITFIKSWIAKRGFTHTDVQYEILDHVATSIELKIDRNPALNLEDAFRLTHAEFGIFGFSTIEESMASKLQRQLLFACLSSLKDILLSWKVLILFAAGLVLISASHITPPSYFSKIVIAITVTSLIVSLLIWIKIYINRRELKKYLSFQLSSSLLTSLLVMSLNFALHIHKILPPTGTIFFIIGFLMLQGSIILGARKMVKKSESLHKLFLLLDSAT